MSPNADVTSVSGNLQCAFYVFNSNYTVAYYASATGTGGFQTLHLGSFTPSSTQIAEIRCLLGQNDVVRYVNW